MIESSDEIIGIVEVDTCSDLESDSVCRKTSEVCTQPGGTKIVNGVPVTKDCWATAITYTCGSGSGEAVTDDGCEGLERREDCKLTESQCLGRDEFGNCTMLTKTFVCGGGTQEIVTGKDCDGELCIAGICEPAKPETSEDFLEGIAVWEILRQAGIYGEVEGDMIFKGTDSGCTVKMMGFSCCRNDVEGTAGSMSNSALSIGLEVGLDAGTELIKWLGSPYVYDILNSFESTQGVLQALYGSAGSGVYSPSFSYYGVSVGISSAGSLTLEFSPTAFLASIALEMAAEYFSCTDEDRMHALRKSRGLCHYVGSFCDKESGAGLPGKARDLGVLQLETRPHRAGGRTQATRNRMGYARAPGDAWFHLGGVSESGLHQDGFETGGRGNCRTVDEGRHACRKQGEHGRRHRTRPGRA